jgi:putative Holliday junction resolvase
MRSLGLDKGDRRTGVAISGSAETMAIPLTVIEKHSDKAIVADVIKLAEQYEIERIVVGLPISLNNTLGRQAEKVIAFSEKLSLCVEQSSLNHIEIKTWDERFSTVEADKLMLEAGTKRNTRKKHRDAMAATLILQGFLDSLKYNSVKD